MNIFDLQATISLNGDAFMQGVQQAQGAFQSLGSSVGAGAVAVGTVVGNMATKAASGLIDLGKESVRTGMNFDAAMSNVAAISGATGEEFDSLRDKAKDMGASTKFTATEAAEAFSYMAMAGWDASSMLSGIEGIMNLAAASGESLATTSDIVTDALTAFGLSAEDSGHFSDVLAAASSAANTNVSMMGETFKYVAPLAGTMGYSIEDMATAIGTMANSGIKGSQAGTALRSAITRLVKPTKEVYTALNQLGLEGGAITNADGSMMSFSETVDVLRDAFSGLDEADQAMYAGMIFGQEAMSGMLAIINSSTDEYDKLADTIGAASEAMGGMGTAAEMAQTQIDNLQGDVTIFQSAFDGLKTAIYDKFKEPLRDAVQAGTEMMSTLTNAVNNGGLSEAFAVIGRSIARFVTTKFDELTSKLGSVGEFLRNAVGTISKYGGQFASAVRDVFNGIRETVSNINFSAIFGGISEKIGGAVEQIGPQIQEKFQKIKDIFADIKQVFADIGTGFTDSFDVGVFSSLGGAVSEFAGAFASFKGIQFDTIISGIKDFVGTFDGVEIGGAVANIAGKVLELAGAFASTSADVINGVTGAVKGFLDKFAESDAPEAIGKLGEKVGPFLSAFLTASADTISGIAGSVKEFLDAFGESDVGEIIGDIAASAADLLGDFLIAGEDVIKGVADGIKKFFDVFDETKAVEAIESVAGVIAKLFEPFTAALGNAIKKAGEGLGDVASNIGELAGHLANDFVDKIKDLADNFEKWAPWVAAVASALVTMKVISEIVPMVSTLKTLFLDLPSITELLSTAFSTLGMVFNSFGGPIGIAITAAVALTTALATAYATNEDFRNSVDAVIKAIGDGVRAAASAVESFFTETLPEALSAFVDWIWELNDKIGSFFTETIPEKFNEMIDWFSDLPDKFKEIGENIVEGIKNGFTSKWNEFKNWVGDLTSGITGFVKGIFGENSPSKVFAEIGLNLVAGMEVGWGREFGTLERQVEQDLDGLTDTAKMKFSDSAIGRSSAAGISSTMALYGQRGGDAVEINLVLDGDVAARALYDPLRRAEAQKGMRKEAAYA